MNENRYTSSMLKVNLAVQILIFVTLIVIITSQAEAKIIHIL
jgi:hypothetical protein